MNTSEAALTGYAARLLVGTGLAPDRAMLVAAGQLSDPGPVGVALREGWNAAEHTHRPAPTTAPEATS